MKRVLFAASEAVPFIKTGGLADVVGSLPKYFDKNEFDVRVIIPKYMCMAEKWKNMMTYKNHFYMDLAWRKQYVGIFELEYEGISRTAEIQNGILSVLLSFREQYCLLCR